ncbi:MAG: LruC domain-containing protein [Candidatus Krumholzibacteriia bacterium]
MTMPGIILIVLMLGLVDGFASMARAAEIYLSCKEDTQIAGVSFKKGDIIKYDKDTGVASLFFSASNFRKGNASKGGGAKIDALYLLSNGKILLSTESKAKLGSNKLEFSAGDIVEYDPQADTAKIYFAESNFRKSEGQKKGTNIDAIFVMDNGHLVLSTQKKAKLGTNSLEFEDGDLVEYDPDNDTASIYLLESTVFRKKDGKSGEGELDGVSILDNGHIVLTTRSDAWVGTNLLSMKDNPIVEYDPVKDTATSYFDALNLKSNETVTALHAASTASSDADGDGVADDQDDYPSDSSKAFDNYSPSKNSYATLAFEDQWPRKGDYDFNDVIVDYNIDQITNADNKVVEISGTFILRAAGASFQNGFGFQLPISPSLVSSVSGIEVGSGYITLTAANLEANQSKAVVIVFDNARSLLPSFNTRPGDSYVTPATISVVVKLSSPVSTSTLGTAPYNPFIIVNKQRGYEVHLADKGPTDLVDSSLFGTGDDDSVPAQGRYYKTSRNLPWGLDVAEKWDYPVEKVEVIDAHLKFEQWAESAGVSTSDWYQEKSGYRDTQKIYQPPSAKLLAR